jgi:hypothetical protein
LRIRDLSGFIKKRISKYGEKEEWILIFKKQLDRIVRIEQPSAEGPLAAGEKIPLILSKKIKIESIPHPFEIQYSTVLFSLFPAVRDEATDSGHVQLYRPQNSPEHTHPVGGLDVGLCVRESVTRRSGRGRPGRLRQ